jgi:hypothetical protein
MAYGILWVSGMFIRNVRIVNVNDFDKPLLFNLERSFLMKLAKALKEKNKLAGEVARLQKLIAEENVVEGKNERTFNPKDMYAALCKTQEELAVLKAAIAKANVLVQGKIFQMAELKARITFLKILPVKEGVTKNTWPAASVEGTEYHSALGKLFVEDEIAKCNIKIETLQEELDNFNFTTDL